MRDAGYRSNWVWVLWAGLAVAAVIAISLIGWQVGWWFRAENIDREVNVQNRNVGTQTAWRDEARNAITDFQLIDPANGAARGSLRIKACGLIDRLTDNYRDQDLVTFETKECS